MKNSRRQRGRSIVLWGLVFLALGQAGLAITLQVWRPELRDPEYGVRLGKLRHRLREHPDRPLVLVLGSSRITNGVAAERLSLPDSGQAKQPIVFNMSLSGGGHMMQLLCLRRLLAQGIRPQAVVLEAMPVYLDYDGQALRTKAYLTSDRIHWRDLGPLCRHAPRLALWRCQQWLEWNSAPFFHDRTRLLARYAPDWVATDQADQVSYWKQLIHPFGWIPLPAEKWTPERRLQETKDTEEHYRPLLQFST